MVIKYYMQFLGDGGEDVSCRIENQHLSLEGDGNGSFPSNYVDTFLDELKCFFLEGLVFPRKHMDKRLVMSLDSGQFV